MIRHIFLIAYRSLLRNKTSSMINLLGLTTGLACSMLIYLWVQDEVHVNHLDSKDDRRYQVFTNHRFANGVQTAEATTGMLVQTLPIVIPEIEDAVCYHHFGNKVPLSSEEHSLRSNGVFASKGFLQFFNFDLLSAKKGEVLSASQDVAISEKLALALFGHTDNVMGKAITIGTNEIFYVSAVYRSPSNAQLDFNFILPFDGLVTKLPQIFANWGNTGPRTFFLLKENAVIDPVVAKLKTYLNDQAMITNTDLLAQRFTDTYLYNHYVDGAPEEGRMMYVKLFSVIALFIVAIACVNFMNLATAKASKRLKEVGIKKVVGSSRKELIAQYFGESFVMVFLSTLLALVLVQVLLPQFNTITQKHLALTIDFPLVAVLISGMIVIALLAGSYPALYLSGFKPAAILKGKLHFPMAEVWTRNGLVTFQFFVSAILITSTIVVYKQIEFIQSQHTGFDKDHVIYFNADGALADKKETFISEMKNIPGVLHATSTDHSVIGQQHQTNLEWEGKKPDENIAFEYIQGNYDIQETLGLELIEGRSFSRSFGDESTGIMLNEAAVKAMGMKDPIGKKVLQFGMTKEIVGVVKDFHFESFHQQVKPLLISFNPPGAFLILARISGENRSRTLEAIADLHGEFNPGFSFDYVFLSDDYGTQYAAEERVGILSRYFGGLAILISCVGLFGLSAFIAERRLKEICIRKILGAGRRDIMALLSAGFARNVFISIVMSLPVAYLLARNWLNNFAYRIDLEPWYFGAAAGVVFVITCVTISIQTIKTTQIDPTQDLKTE